MICIIVRRLVAYDSPNVGLIIDAPLRPSGFEIALMQTGLGHLDQPVRDIVTRHIVTGWHLLWGFPKTVCWRWNMYLRSLGSLVVSIKYLLLLVAPSPTQEQKV